MTERDLSIEQDTFAALGARLVELVNLRVSQINGCGVCIDMHWRDLVKQGAAPSECGCRLARRAVFISMPYGK